MKDKKDDTGEMQTKTVKLTSDFCSKKELGKFVDYINYIDSSDGTEQKVRLELQIQTFPATRKAELSMIAQERYPKDPVLAQQFEQELVMAEALGIDHIDIMNLKASKPSGVYDSIGFQVNTRLGTFSGLTSQKVQEQKNEESQE